MTPKRKYHFYWGLLGNLDLGRPNLGPTSRLEVYRLMQFTLRDVLEHHIGTEKADQIFYESGKLAGSQFYQNLLGEVADFGEFIKRIQSTFIDMGIGIFRVEQADLQTNSFVFTVSEDLDCSGLPELD
jgi:hypothetical protein